LGIRAAEGFWNFEFHKSCGLGSDIWLEEPYQAILSHSC
jgi:hypothetical protein